jgi:hypothetical protein
MSRRPYRLVPLLLLLPVPVVAQVALDSVARRFAPRQSLRLHSQGGQHVEGRFISALSVGTGCQEGGTVAALAVGP